MKFCLVFILILVAKIGFSQEDNSCHEDEQKAVELNCQSFASNLLPDGAREKNFHVMMEVKYTPLEPRMNRNAQAFAQREYNLVSFYKTYGGDKINPPGIGFENEVDRVFSHFQKQKKTNLNLNTDRTDVRNQLILWQLKKTTSYEHMMDMSRGYTQNLSDEDYVKFLGTLGSLAEYNDKRAEFWNYQTEDGGLGKIGPFEQITGLKSGICGDIHSMVAIFAEQRGWEAFTIGYATEGGQHVITATVNPTDESKLMIINYGKYETEELNDGNSLEVTPDTGGMTEIGIQLRIFKNEARDGGYGRMKEIATVPTVLGSFMKDLFQKENQISAAMAQNQNFSVEKIDFRSNNEKVKTSENKIVEKHLSDGVMVYEGRMENAQVIGLAVSHDVFKNIYKYNKETKTCELRKNRYFSVGLSPSIVQLSQADLYDNIYLYLNVKGGVIHHLYQSEHFQFKGFLGYELDGFGNADSDGKLMSGDGNLAGYFGVISDYEKNGLKIHSAIKLETTVGLRDQNLYTDFSALSTNINPTQFNAVSVDLNIAKKMNEHNTFVTNNNFTMTRVGGRLLLSTGVIHNNTSIMASYQGGVKALPIGLSLQHVNLLQNFNAMDGFRLSVGHMYSNRSGTVSGNISGWGGISTSTAKPQPMFGGTIKLNLNTPKKKVFKDPFQ